MPLLVFLLCPDADCLLRVALPHCLALSFEFSELLVPYGSPPLTRRGTQYLTPCWCAVLVCPQVQCWWLGAPVPSLPGFARVLVLEAEHLRLPEASLSPPQRRGDPIDQQCNHQRV